MQHFFNPAFARLDRVFTMRDLESMAAYSGYVPPGGFKLIEPNEEKTA